MNEINILKVIREIQQSSTEYYYVSGECPELMSHTRLLEYASNILQANIGEEGVPEVGRVTTLEQAIKIIDWFGETVCEVDWNITNSMHFIMED